MLSREHEKKPILVIKNRYVCTYKTISIMQTPKVQLKSIRKNYRCSENHTQQLKQIKKMLKRNKSELELTDTAIIEEAVNRFYTILKGSTQTAIGLS